MDNNLNLYKSNLSLTEMLVEVAKPIFPQGAQIRVHGEGVREVSDMVGFSKEGFSISMALFLGEVYAGKVTSCSLEGALAVSKAAWKEYFSRAVLVAQRDGGFETTETASKSLYDIFAYGGVD